MLRLCLITLILMLPIAASAQDRYASIIVDANTLDVLHARKIDAPRHPASLTKIMTLYLTFDAIERGRLSLDGTVTVSAQAAATPPGKIGLRTGATIDIDTLVQAVAVRSANDAAVALAEAVDGSEGQFVDRMNRTAAALGMSRTEFRNPHGLPDDEQITTARDMVKLALATQTRFPQHYHYFSQAQFRGRANTNKLLSQRSDVDGFKTGYTRASGYNLLIGATQGDQRILAVVLGGASSGSRNSHMSDLIDRGFEVLNTHPEPQTETRPVIAASHPAQSIGSKQWALQIDGFKSPAETAILADQLVRASGRGQVRAHSRTTSRGATHSIRIDALDQRSARALCAQHGDILKIKSRRCMVLSLGNSR